MEGTAWHKEKGYTMAMVMEGRSLERNRRLHGRDSLAQKECHCISYSDGRKELAEGVVERKEGTVWHKQNAVVYPMVMEGRNLERSRRLYGRDCLAQTERKMPCLESWKHEASDVCANDERGGEL